MHINNTFDHQKLTVVSQYDQTIRLVSARNLWDFNIKSHNIKVRILSMKYTNHSSSDQINVNKTKKKNLRMYLLQINNNVK